MDDEVQLISDGDGLAVIGSPSSVERFLFSEGLESTELNLDRIRPTTVSAAAGAVEAVSIAAANSGRWVKLTDESAAAIKKFGLMKSSKTGLDMGVIQGKGTNIKGLVQFAKGPGAKLTDPAILSGVAGIMQQRAMQQAMDEITDYLVIIDAKIDDLLLAQKNAVLADMIGVDLVIDEAMTIRTQVGRVSEVTWSKVQSTSVTIARTQAYALLELDALAVKMERPSSLGDIAKTTKASEQTVQEWLAVLASCFKLQDAIAILELDRVLDSSPEDLDQHRIAVRVARQNRLDLIARATEKLMARMDAAAGTANKKVLLHPVASPAVVGSSNQLSNGVVDFQGVLGIDQNHQSMDRRRWVEAATDVRDDVIGAGAHGASVAIRFGSDTANRVKTIAQRGVKGSANVEEPQADEN